MTELEILTGGGVTVMIGGEEVTFRPLPIAKDLEWRKAVGKILASVSRQLDAETPQKIMAGMVEYLSGEGLDEMLQASLMLTDSTPDFTKATRVELTKAIIEVVREIYLPFVGCVLTLQKTLACGSQDC